VPCFNSDDSMESIVPFSHYWIFVFIIILFASTIQGMTGFGAALLAGPMLTLFLEAKLVVIIIMVTGMGSLLCVVYYARKHIFPKKVLPLAIPGVFGVPLGAYILARVASSITSLCIAAISIMFSVVLLMGCYMPIKRETLASLGFGFASGVMCAGVGMGGPPLILFLTNQRWVKEIFRATVAIHFLIIGTLAIALYVLTGVATYSRVIISVSFVPAALMGFFFGNLIFHRVSGTFFSRVSLSLILIAGMNSLSINLWKIL
jgi:uncharacterized membrane protein YfcA